MSGLGKLRKARVADPGSRTRALAAYETAQGLALHRQPAPSAGNDNMPRKRVKRVWSADPAESIIIG